MTIDKRIETIINNKFQLKDIHFSEDVPLSTFINIAESTNPLSNLNYIMKGCCIKWDNQKHLFVALNDVECICIKTMGRGGLIALPINDCYITNCKHE